MKENTYKAILSDYLPENSINYIIEKLRYYHIDLKIKNDRKTKLGDYKHYINNIKKPIITINAGLNKYAFLLVLLHEIAHAEIYAVYNSKVKPHGKEWKQAFSNMLNFAIQADFFPSDLANVIKTFSKNPKAASYSDISLVKILKKYDKNKPENVLLLEEVPNNVIFELNGKKYQKEQKRRTRYICVNQDDGKKYLISKMAEVIVIPNSII